MAIPSTNQFLTRFPEFGELASTVVDGAIAEASRITPSTVWSNTQTEAISYLAAHLLASRSMQIGIQVGSPSGAPTGTQLDSTLYGQEYRRLRDTLTLSGFAI